MVDVFSQARAEKHFQRVSNRPRLNMPRRRSATTPTAAVRRAPL
jgi:hypothetical protein